ncbi:MAG TPA: hypothetical protein VFE47_23970 [Tepidisphaeraceae bacterium]|jgi:hypothetical protein|nr:hypothetical protein [Tepidisphaeraceae bacterium]
MPNQPPRRKHWVRRTLLYLAILILLVITCGLTGNDEAADRTFLKAVDQWQTDPEFRAVAMEYSTRGSDATRTHLFGIPARRVVIALRSLPFLPKEYAVNPTSRKHYEDFARGPLSAYLHLCSEQDVKDMAGIFTEAAQKSTRSDGDLRHVLDGFKMDFPVAKDQGALRSVDAVLRDTHAAGGFPIHENIDGDLLAPIAELAGELHIPADPEKMTADQQRAVFDRLDSYVHARDEELWRTKQINDFCSGVWAQVYGPPYKTCVVPVVWMHTIGETLLIVLLLILAWRGLHRRIANAPAEEANKMAA